PICSPISSNFAPMATSPWRDDRRRPPSRESSPPAMSSTPFTARPSPQPVPAALRPSMPSITSPTSIPRRARRRLTWRPTHPESASARLRVGNETHHPTVPANEIRCERRLLMSTEVTDASFEETVLKSDKPVLVDFWAPWCGPCRMVSPIVDQIGEEHAEKLNVVKVNTDE